jgi:hypothetical protein
MSIFLFHTALADIVGAFVLSVTQRLTDVDVGIVGKA